MMYTIRWIMILKVMMIFWGIGMPSMIFADKSATHWQTAGKINIWFAMQLPLFVEWPNRPSKSSVDSQSKPQLLVNFCLDISDPQRYFFSKNEMPDHIGYELKIKLIEYTFQLDQCHIFIIHKSQEHQLPALLIALKNKPILTISDIDHFAEKGGMVAVSFKEGRLRYQFNVRAARASGLKISARVLDLAEVVYD